MEHKDLTETLMIAISAALVNLHTATIAKITKVNATTINCRPVINRVIDGVSIPLPEFVEVPPIFMQGGSSYTAHPIAVGDYCLLIFTERCFDRWYAGQDFQSPAELRMHDYSDGVAICGINPLSGAITIPDVIQTTGDTNHDGNAVHTGDYDHTGDYNHTGDVLRTGDMTITGDLTLTGALHVTGTITATGAISGASIASGAGVSAVGTISGADVTATNDVVVGTISLKTHIHGGVAPGGQFTNPPS